MIDLEYPLWTFAPAAAYVLLLLLVVGTPVVSLITETYGFRAKKPFAIKLSRQLDLMGSWALVLTILAGAVTGYFLMPQTPYLPAVQRALTPELLIAFAATGGMMLLFWILRALTWKLLKKKKGLHILLGVILMIALLAFFFLLAGVKARFFSHAPGEIGPVPLGAYFSWPATSMFWPVVSQLLLLSLGLAWAIALPFLLVRRNRDDFGRDYYNWSITNAARWALVFMLGQFIVLPWVYLLGLEIGSEHLAFMIGFVVAIFLCAAVWLILLRSITPLRWKGLIILSVFFVWAALVFWTMTAENFLPSDLFASQTP
ncbi:MAG: hypothetical protein ACLFTB_03800 [Desulfovibrionales bacterium]